MEEEHHEEDFFIRDDKEEEVCGYGRGFGGAIIANIYGSIGCGDMVR